MDPPPQVKPLRALKELSEPKRRLVNKLIVSLHSNQIDDKVQAAINRTINRARRSPDDPKYYNGYMVFYKERFPELKKTGGNITSIAKELGKQWRTLSDEERATYNQNARHQTIDNKPTDAKAKVAVTKRARVEVNQ
jgi:hypothetical protein